MAKDTIIKAKLKEAGISYRHAAKALGVTYQHLCYVVNGDRKSYSLSLRILHLCDGTIPLPPKIRKKRSPNKKAVCRISE